MDFKRFLAIGIAAVAAIAIAFIAVATPVVSWAIPFSRSARMLAEAERAAALAGAVAPSSRRSRPWPTWTRPAAAASPFLATKCKP